MYKDDSLTTEHSEQTVIPIHIQRLITPRTESGGWLITCCQCGKNYEVTRLHVEKPVHRCQQCRGRNHIVKLHRTFKCNQATKKQKINANGIINMRIRRNRLKRPTKCAVCNGTMKSGRSMIGHHYDYAKPDTVLFCCDRCHWHCHHTEGFEDRHASKQVVVCKDGIFSINDEKLMADFSLYRRLAKKGAK